MCVRHLVVSISQSRCLSFQVHTQIPGLISCIVSISQSRFLSFQVRHCLKRPCVLCIVSISQSRFLSFQAHRRQPHRSHIGSFNLAIEMLVISGSRRVCCHGRSRTQSFNLAIEILVISGQARWSRVSRIRCVSISQSRCLSFQGGVTTPPPNSSWVSISQSRCLSFQVTAQFDALSDEAFEFQSRNRDSCHFRTHLQLLVGTRDFSFNLAIEILVISGLQPNGGVASSSKKFQSRNRDSCHFR